MTRTALRYRYVGTTDDQVVCDKCGKEDLRSTVIIACLDADGNVEDTVYYGSSCAARVLAERYGVKITARKVLDAAQAAQREAVAADLQARETLAYYGLPIAGEASVSALDAAAVLYAHAHRSARWAATADWPAMVRAMLATRQADVLAA